MVEVGLTAPSWLSPPTPPSPRDSSWVTRTLGCPKHLTELFLSKLEGDLLEPFNPSVQGRVVNKLLVATENEAPGGDSQSEAEQSQSEVARPKTPTPKEEPPSMKGKVTTLLDR